MTSVLAYVLGSPIMGLSMLGSPMLGSLLSGVRVKVGDNNLSVRSEPILRCGDRVANVRVILRLHMLGPHVIGSLMSGLANESDVRVAKGVRVRVPNDRVTEH